MVIAIQDGGLMEFIYNDDMAELLDAGTSVVRRASHVEPVDGGGWQADMSPVGGPCLSITARRQDALAEEVDWLNQNYIGKHDANQTLHKM